MKDRYRFHHEYLDFVEEKRSFRKILWNILVYLMAIVFMTVAYYIVFSIFFDTREERAMERENVLLTEQAGILQGKMVKVEEVLGQLEQRDAEIFRAIFHANMSTLDSTRRHEDYTSFDDVVVAGNTSLKMQHLSQQAMRISRQIESVTAMLQQTGKDSILAIPLMQPIDNKDLSRVGATVGMRMHPFYKLLKHHTGIDFIAGIGTDVYATGAGLVQLAARAQRTAGNRVEIDHGNGYVTTYSHLSDVLVKKGQTVQRGQVIARVGNTGMSVASHLHYEVLKDDNYMDPLNYFFLDLTPVEYEVLRRLSTSSGQSLD